MAVAYAPRSRPAFSWRLEDFLNDKHWGRMFVRMCRYYPVEKILNCRNRV